MRKAVILLLLLCYVLLPGTQANAADLSRAFPADGFMVLYTTNLDNLNLVGERLAQAWNIPITPQIKGFLDVARQSGLNTQGETALLWLDTPGKSAASSALPPFVVLAAVKDSAQLQRSLTADAEGIFVLKASYPTAVYILPAGGYAVAALDKEAIRLYRQQISGGTLILPPQMKTALMEHDTSLVINIKKLRALWGDTFPEQVAVNAFTAATHPELPFYAAKAGTRAPKSPIIPDNEAITKKMLEEWDLGLLTFKTGDKAVSATFFMHFTPGGFFTGWIDRHQTSQVPDFHGLPAGNWVMAGYFTNDKLEDAYRKYAGSSYKPVSLPQKPRDVWEQFAVQNSKIAPWITDGRFAWYAGTDSLSPGLMQGVYIIGSTDAEKLGKELGQAVKQIAGAYNKEKTANYKLGYKSAAITIGTRQAQHIQLKFTVKNKNKDTQEMLDFLKQVNGSDTVSLYLMPVDRQTFLLGVGGSESLLAATANTLEAGLSPLRDDPLLQEARSQLIYTNLGMICIMPGRLMDAAGSGGMFETMLGGPVVANGGVNNGVIAVQLHVPHPLLKMLFGPKNYPFEPVQRRSPA